jgi:hypothetical protein
MIWWYLAAVWGPVIGYLIGGKLADFMTRAERKRFERYAYFPQVVSLKPPSSPTRAHGPQGSCSGDE